MRQSKFIPACLAVLIVCAAPAQSTNHASWLGVWHGELDGQPGVTLTLAEEAGKLGGTVVFNMVSRENGTPQVVGSAVHMVTHPSLDGNTLSFQVKRASDAKQLQIAVVLIGSDKMKMQCVNCGDDSTSAELVKSRP